MFLRLPRPTVFAHRGASAYAPENTLAALELAVQQNADAIELDVKLTLDGHVVVIHDQSVDRTTDGEGRVSQMTLDEIKELDAGSHFDPTYHGEPIPTLNNVLESLGKSIYINIELTNYSSPLDDLPQKVADLVLKHALSSHILFSSFNPIALIGIKRRLPSVPIALLCLPGQGGAWARSRLGYILRYQALHPEKGDVTEILVDRVHRYGYRIHTYTVNRSDDIHRMYNLNVDGIFTDDPILAREILDKHITPI